MDNVSKGHKAMKVTLLIPTLNEIDGVREIMPRVKKDWVDEIIVIDGNSTDGTHEYFTERGFNVINQRSAGAVAAWWEGFEAASGEVIILFSPDNNSIPELIPSLIEKMKEGYDMVIASRYYGGAKSDDDNLLTAFGNFIFTKAINLIFKGNYTDTLVMYRAFKKELLTKLKFDKNKDPLFEIPLSIRCLKHKLKITEIPGDEPLRIGGRISRAHPGILGRLRGGSLMLYCLIKEIFIWD